MHLDFPFLFLFLHVETVDGSTDMSCLSFKCVSHCCTMVGPKIIREMCMVATKVSSSFLKFSFKRFQPRNTEKNCPKHQLHITYFTFLSVKLCIYISLSSSSMWTALLRLSSLSLKCVLPPILWLSISLSLSFSLSGSTTKRA